MYALQILIDAFSLGSLFALSALGIGLVFGIMRLINFAYGEFITFGAYALVVPSSGLVAVKFIGNWPAPAMVAAIVTLVVALALLTERVAFRPVRQANPATLLISSFAVSYLLQHVILFVHSSRPKSVNILPELTEPFVGLGLRIPIIDVVTIVVGAVMLAGIAGFLKLTSFGIQMRAAVEDFRMARLLGVRANAVVAVTFAITGVLAGTVSLLFVTKTGVLDYRMGLPLVLVAFVATVVGGMGSIFGPVLGGFLLGFLSVVFQATLPEELRPLRDAFVFFCVIVILLVRPQGLVRVRSASEERV